MTKIKKLSKYEQRVQRCLALADYIIALQEEGLMPKEGGEVDDGDFIRCVEDDLAFIEADIESTEAKEGNPHSVMNLVVRMNNGATQEELTKEIEDVGKKRAEQPGKKWGKCDSCGTTTVLVADVDMCGPCTFGEADTYNGNW